MDYKRLAVYHAAHPEVAEEGLLPVLKYLVLKLNDSKDAQTTGFVFQTVAGGMRERLTALQVQSGYLADLMLLMQFIGLLRKEGSGKRVKWEVADSDLIDEFLTDASLHAGLLKLVKHSGAYNKCARLTERIKTLEKNSDSPPCSGDTEKELLAHLAKGAAQYTDLQAAYEEQSKELEALKKEHENSTSPTALEIAGELMKNFTS